MLCMLWYVMVWYDMVWYVWTYVRTYVCMYVCMYVYNIYIWAYCMYLYTYVYVMGCVCGETNHAEISMDWLKGKPWRETVVLMPVQKRFLVLFSTFKSGILETSLFCWWTNMWITLIFSRGALIISTVFPGTGSNNYTPLDRNIAPFMWYKAFASSPLSKKHLIFQKSWKSDMPSPVGGFNPPEKY